MASMLASSNWDQRIALNLPLKSSGKSVATTTSWINEEKKLLSMRIDDFKTGRISNMDYMRFSDIDMKCS